MSPEPAHRGHDCFLRDELRVAVTILKMIVAIRSVATEVDYPRPALIDRLQDIQGAYGPPGFETDGVSMFGFPNHLANRTHFLVQP